jgi:hypothetical protein
MRVRGAGFAACLLFLGEAGVLGDWGDGRDAGTSGTAGGIAQFRTTAMQLLVGTSGFS